MNTYSYVSGNPLKYVDSTGLLQGPLPGTEIAPATTTSSGIGVLSRAFGSITMMLWPSSLGDGELLTPEVTERLNNFPDADIDALCSKGGGKDPCKGLRDSLSEHIQKLRDFLRNPFDPKNDNDGRLAKNPVSRHKNIVSGRIWNLLNQIENFRRLVEECERQNGTR